MKLPHKVNTRVELASKIGKGTPPDSNFPRSLKNWNLHLENPELYLENPESFLKNTKGQLDLIENLP